MYASIPACSAYSGKVFCQQWIACILHCVIGWKILPEDYATNCISIKL
jgi:hypothetical protein